MILIGDSEKILNNTDINVEIVSIGDFWGQRSKIEISQSEIALSHPPVLFRSRNDLVWLNDSDDVLLAELKKTKQNSRVLSYVISNTDLTLDELKDAFNLITLKYLSNDKVDRTIINEIISENRILNKLCPQKSSQLSFLYKHYCKNNIASQKLAKKNKELDIVLSKKLLGSIEPDTIKEFEIENKTRDLVNKVKSSNNKLYLLDILINLKELYFENSNDIIDNITFLSEKNALNLKTLKKISLFISRLKKHFSYKIHSSRLIFIIKKIDSIKEKEEGTKYSFINEIIVKDENNSIIQAIKFISKELEKSIKIEV
ncbi:hypothetical protein MSP8887_00571 [Marinomonas spartinae]|uniref:hypothetical protein n=1 Tax=Marinomonas spartinae TaxID=1792290 RepID=UPI000808C562|nr:hypothetical protein [Marinomonas spartinae]SBS27203.1 hypothetical protein MSP8887_00571 [Marinomonas spartinae]